MKTLVLFLLCLCGGYITKEPVEAYPNETDDEIKQKIIALLRDVDLNDLNHKKEERFFARADVNKVLNDKLEDSESLSKSMMSNDDLVTGLKRSESGTLIKQVEEKLTAMIIEQTETKLPDLLMKVTAFILKKIGRTKYIVPDDDNHVTAECLEIGTAVSLGQGLITTAVGAIPEVGPAAAVATAGAFFVFQVLKMSLDLEDVGGYGKMKTVEQYMELKIKLDKFIKDAFRDHGAKYPSQVGPLDKLSADEFKENLYQQLKKVMNPENKDSLLEAMWFKIQEDITAGTLTDSDINNSAKMKLYLVLIDIDQLLQQCMNSMCTELGGKLVNRGGLDFRCSYKDKESCESSYTYPLQETDIYAEYKSTEGTCNHGGYTLRIICEEKGLPYDTDKGLCVISEEYCLMKGGEWMYSEKIKENDCVITKVQDVFENIFGKTIVRGLKQLFDPKQYKPCNSDETDDGYFCRNIWCHDGEEQWENGGICYKKCQAGFHPFGCCICSPDCPEGWTDDGATCRKAGQCKLDEEHQGVLCFKKCNDGYTGVGPVCWQQCPDGYEDKGAYCLRSGSIYAKKTRPADKQACANGLRDDGINCWKDTYGRGAGSIPEKTPCPSGLRDDGTSCWSDAHIYGKGCCCTIFGCCGNCHSGYHDDGCTCRKVDVGIKLSLFQRQKCNDGDEMVAGLCYRKCSSGYHAVGCCLCEPDGGPRIEVTLAQRQYCNDNEVNVAGVCWEKCKEGYTDDGAICRDSFTKKSYGRSAGTPDTQIQTKPQTSYGRGVGTTAVHIRAKERAIAFSTKKNK